MTDAQFGWTLFINTMVAVGTIGSVVAALFGNILRAKMLPPKLRFNLVNPAGEKNTAKDRETGEDISAVRYYHLRIDNLNRRWTPATSLALHLVRLDVRRPDGTFGPEWVGDAPVRCRDQELYPLRQVVGRSIQYDLCSVMKDPVLALYLHPIAAPNNLTWQWAGACQFIASLQAKSTEVDSDIARVRVSWDGQWEEGEKEMLNHLQVELLPT